MFEQKVHRILVFGQSIRHLGENQKVEFLPLFALVSNQNVGEDFEEFFGVVMEVNEFIFGGGCQELRISDVSDGFNPKRHKSGVLEDKPGTFLDDRDEINNIIFQVLRVQKLINLVFLSQLVSVNQKRGLDPQIAHKLGVVEDLPLVFGDQNEKRPTIVFGRRGSDHHHQNQSH